MHVQNLVKPTLRKEGFGAPHRHARHGRTLAPEDGRECSAIWGERCITSHRKNWVPPWTRSLAGEVEAEAAAVRAGGGIDTGDKGDGKREHGLLRHEPDVLALDLASGAVGLGEERTAEAVDVVHGALGVA